MTTTTGHAAVNGAAAGEFLTFRLADEEYAIEILKVQEIRRYETPTAIVNAPAFIKGVINLRGTIVPIVDLRVKLGREARYDGFTVVIILNVEERALGIVVDSVCDVTRLSTEQIRPAPEYAGAVDASFVSGLGTLEKRLLIIASVERLMNTETRTSALPGDGLRAATGAGTGRAIH